VKIFFAIILTTTFAAPRVLQGDEKDPQPITLKLGKVSPRDALAELAKQTGATFKFETDIASESKEDNSIPKLIDVDLQDKTFWTCVDEICRAANLQAIAGGEDTAIDISFVKPLDDNTLGAFAFSPVSIGPAATFQAMEIRNNNNRDLSGADNRVERDCLIYLGASIDPRLHVIKYLVVPAIESAVDESGTSIAAPSTSDAYFEDVPSQMAIRGINIPLDYDSAKSKKLTLKGSLHVQAALAIETMSIDDLAKSEGAEKTLAGIRLTIDEVAIEEHKSTLKLTISRNDADEELWKRVSEDFLAEMTTCRADGERADWTPASDQQDDAITYTLTYSYAEESGKPVKLIWNLPTSVEERDLPFEFKDLPLP
jgi:hypothetical protein